MQYLLHRAGYGIEAIADSKDELFALLAGIEDATGYSVKQALPTMITGDVLLKECTRFAAAEMYETRCEMCAVDDPANPEASFPDFIRQHIHTIREDFAEYRNSLREKAYA